MSRNICAIFFRTNDSKRFINNYFYHGSKKEGKEESSKEDNKEEGSKEALSFKKTVPLLAGRFSVILSTNVWPRKAILQEPVGSDT